MAMTEDERSIWEALAPVILHPIQVAILEALEWIERPLSATELAKLFGDPDITHSLTHYHLTALAKAGAIEIKDSRKARGSTEWFFGFVASSSSLSVTADERSRSAIYC